MSYPFILWDLIEFQILYGSHDLVSYRTQKNSFQQRYYFFLEKPEVLHIIKSLDIILKILKYQIRTK
jgi:hypothetical protein